MIRNSEIWPTSGEQPGPFQVFGGLVVWSISSPFWRQPLECSIIIEYFTSSYLFLVVAAVFRELFSVVLSLRQIRLNFLRRGGTA